MKKKNMRLFGTSLFTFLFVIASLAGTAAYAAPGDGGGAQQYRTGVKPYTAEDIEWMKEHMEKTEKVLPNKIGLKRANEVRRQKGLKEISEKAAVGIGDEVITDRTAPEFGSRMFSADSSVAELSQSDLKSHVDNSTELPYFPPIRDQQSLGSCTAFAITYYQATHMNAMARGWNTKNNSDNSNKFSPRWSYNFLNAGLNLAINDIEAYKLFLEQGVAVWDDLPYVGNPSNLQNYREWTSDPEVWRNALNYKADKVGYVEVADGTDTPVEYEKDDSLTDIKRLLSNGYVLCILSDIFNWKYKPVLNNDLSGLDDGAVGEAACYMVDTRSYDTWHEMTVVGYNDDIWVDINGNGSMDTGEKGAFKIANSWGTDWKVKVFSGQSVNTGGYVWFCYDALNLKSAVASAPAAEGRRIKGWGGNHATWVTFKESNTPALLAQITVNHSKRNQLECEIGYSEVNESASTSTYKSMLLNGNSGDCSFDGVNQSSDGTMVFDYTSLIDGKDLSLTTKKWYVTIRDVNQDGNKGTVKSFKLIEPSTGTETEYPITTYPEVDGSSVTMSIQYQIGSQPDSETQWIYREDISYNINYIGHEIVSMGGKLYIIGENGDDSAKNMLLEYDPAQGTCSLIDDNFPRIGEMSKIAGYNGKMYVLEAQSPTSHYFETDQLKIYDIASKSYTSEDLPGTLIRTSSLVECGGKIYVVQDYTFSATGDWIQSRHLLEYDPSAGIFATKAGMQNLRVNPDLVAVDGQIYVFSGEQPGTGGCVEAVEKYDPANDIWSVIDTMPEYIIEKTNTASNYRAVSIYGKIYLFIDLYVDLVYEYDPASHIWTEKGFIPVTVGDFGVQQANGKIYVIPENTHNILEFNPVAIQSPMVPIPYMSPAGGTYSVPQTITISTSDSEATIRYTTDGTTPTDSSPVYTEQIAVQENMTIKAVATKNGMTDSYVTTAEYVIAPQVQGPVFDIAGGTYKYAQRVSLTCATPGAEIRYTTDGTAPKSWSTLYTEPITVSGNRMVRAIAMKQGMPDSQISSASYSTHSLIGDVDGDGGVNASDLAAITQYVAGTLNDFPVEDDLWAGDVNGDGAITAADRELVRQFVMGTIPYFPKQKLPVPVFSLEEGTYAGARTLTINCPEDEAIIRYTTDGSAPDSSSPVYNGPVNVSESMTVKAIATLPLFVDSDAVSASYIIAPKGDAPTFSPEGGAYTSIQTVSISTATEGAEIRYTTDGSTPTQNSSLYSGPITLNASKTIKAIALKSGSEDSDEASAEYALSFRIGDVNGDGNIDQLDYDCLRDYITEAISAFPVEDELWVGDVNGDAAINALDLALMRLYLNGQIQYFPKEQQ
ncbi:chitobiase/beta-hexosaminidase-like protein [Anaerobacterium chartisolvens]|uniref:Chitobiase/beta-hexosaminidase-like protein n=1 Tax=Anaerobacterium chartisolvens TaxID=1297424 RepID=A0A369AQB9_9FIRM|nr:chitobiase/beta-hexosaminidase C-terminal domain-containing protein [Anaerobacterium chartisolvens]RCX10528.1 chitobiase/beta-hexosaminidase-like protein [Anaerobacterium chartisolvens]